MVNPWYDLPAKPPYVLACDSCAVGAFNLLHEASPKLVLQTQLLPEPFFGRVEASVYVLGLNPGYSSADDSWHMNKAFTDAVRRNLVHEELEYPHYYLAPQFKQSPGAGWWRRKCKWLIDDCGLEAVAQNLFCAELSPYHSSKYKPLRKTVSPNGLVESSSYTAVLLRQALAERKQIVAMRSFKAWCRSVPELATYANVYRLNSPQNVSLSPNNIPRYSELVGRLRRNLSASEHQTS